MARVIFITGTDTSVGKTALTALLLAHAQSHGINVRALKPFSTGDRSDEALLSSLQKSSLQINFFHYLEPISPWSAARLHQSPVTLDAALAPIQEHRSSCELLLVEGAGGLLTPLGENFSTADLISELPSEVILVAANKLGTLNHTRLTFEALRHRAIKSIRVALVTPAAADASSESNLRDLKELLPNVSLVPIPFLEDFRPEADFIRTSAKNMHGTLASLLQT